MATTEELEQQIVILTQRLAKEAAEAAETISKLEERAAVTESSLERELKH